MKAFARIVLLLCLVQLPMQSHAEKYRSDAHGFACNFPGVVKKSTGRTRDGLVLTYFMSLAPDNSWGAHVSTGFADPREAANLSAWFRDFSDGLSGSGFATSAAKIVSIHGRPAVKYNIAGNGTTGTAYVVIDEDRFVSIAGFALEGKDHSMIEPFLQSLEILER